MAAAQKDTDGDTTLKGAGKPSAQEALTQPVLPPMRVLEEDDEFEEFEEDGECARPCQRCVGVSPQHASNLKCSCTDWGANQTTKEDEKLWQDDWDDDEIDNDFCNQLRAQLVASGVMTTDGAAAEKK